MNNLFPGKMKGPELFLFPGLSYSSENNCARARSGQWEPPRTLDVRSHWKALLEGAALGAQRVGNQTGLGLPGGRAQTVLSAISIAHGRAGSGPRVLGLQRTQRPACALLKQTTFFYR